ncbi:MAG: D-2-hydroxyacid dehydrogenase [Sporocytophaga sp.]|jgi:lactate dehydrogenase-like 2-hydroxyacid dehydrogenase|nr:D-2-hydroxyacid dehydrogenase [Sporocytophaga sp.]
MKIVLLDADTLGEVPAIDDFHQLGEFIKYGFTKPDEVITRLAGADVAITNKVVLSKEVLSQLPDLKLICVAATGTDNVNVAFASEKGIPVKNVKGYSTDSVAQHTFSLLLHLADKLEYYNNYVLSGEYSKSEIFTSLVRPYWEIKGKVYGIIGLGAIGKKVANIATAFGAKVIYYSTSGVHDDPDFKRVELDELLKQSDIISIHSPLNDKTRGLLGEKEFSLMKKNAILINVGRGGIVNENALIEALNNDRIAGAGIDVFEKEPMTVASPILKIKNKERLIVTPHIAWASIEARNRLVEGIISNIKEWTGEKLKA